MSGAGKWQWSNFSKKRQYFELSELTQIYFFIERKSEGP